MDVTLFASANEYTAPKHHGCSCFRLQGLDASNTDDFWVGMSHFLPGGGAETDSSPFEKVYVVTAGEITVEAQGEKKTLKVNDSCYIPAHEVRTVVNQSKLPASMLVIITKHAKAL
jgi:quercetin dioxygenase-like cupin family protein